MRNKPKTEAEFKALAYEMADTGSFRDARHIFHALSVWPDETRLWWSKTLAVALDARCRGLALKPKSRGDAESDR